MFSVEGAPGDAVREIEPKPPVAVQPPPYFLRRPPSPKLASRWWAGALPMWCLPEEFLIALSASLRLPVGLCEPGLALGVRLVCMIGGSCHCSHSKRCLPDGGCVLPDNVRGRAETLARVLQEPHVFSLERGF